MHECSPLGALICSDCSSFWCYECAYRRYFSNVIVILDNITIIKRNRCVRLIKCWYCKEFFKLPDRDKLESIRSWGTTLIDSGDTTLKEVSVLGTIEF